MPVFTCAYHMLPRNVCLIPQLFWLHAARIRAACAAHSQYMLSSAAPPCSIHVLTRFALVLPLRACTPTPVTCTDCPNECLYQFQSRSAGYVVLCACLRAQRAYECALAIANELGEFWISYAHCPLIWSLNSI
jgi:hypothetical protein